MDAEGKTDYLYIYENQDEVFFSKRFRYAFILTILIMFIFFLFLHTTLDLDGLPPGWVTIH